MPHRPVRPALAGLLQVRRLVPSSLSPSFPLALTPSPSSSSLARSPSMYGTVLDQRVFEHLVQRCLPFLHDHFAANDIQLSVASLPWFLSLYISSMPMVFAFRCVVRLALVLS